MKKPPKGTIGVLGDIQANVLPVLVAGAGMTKDGGLGISFRLETGQYVTVLVSAACATYLHDAIEFLRSQFAAVNRTN